VKSYFDIEMKEMTERMNNGETPPEFIDRFQIAPEEHPQIKKISDELRKIMDKILSANQKKIWDEYDFDSRTFKPAILISLQDVTNAFTIPEVTKFPIIVVTLNLIQEAKSEDEIAGVLGHEIHHNLLPRVTQAKYQGQLGESACDVWTVEALRNADYQSIGFAEFFKRGKSTEVSISSSHPSHNTRLMQIGNAEVYLDKTKGKKNIKTKPLIPKSKVLSEQKPDIPFETEFQKKLKRNNFQTAKNQSSKFAIIVDLLKKGEFGHPESKGNLYSRESVVNLIMKELKNLLPIPANQNETYFEKLQELRNWLIQTEFDGFEKKWIRWCDEEIQKNTNHYNDHVNQLQSAIHSFTSDYIYKSSTYTTPYESSLREAKKIIELLMTHFNSKNAQDHLNSSYLNGLSRSYFHSFEGIYDRDIESLKENESITPSWDSAVQLALQEYKENNTTNIASALNIVGITMDPRLDFLKDKLLYPYVVVQEGRWQKEKLTINENGKVVNPNAISRRLQEQKLIETIDWNQLREPPIGIGFGSFTQKYKRFFVLEYAPQRGQNFETDYQFTKEFLEKITTLPSEEIENIAKKDDFRKFTSEMKSSNWHGRVNVDIPITQFIINKSQALPFYSSERAWRNDRNELLIKTNYLNKATNNWQFNNKKDFDVPEFKTVNDLNEYINTVDLSNTFELQILYHEVIEFIKTKSDQIKPEDLSILDKIPAAMDSFNNELFEIYQKNLTSLKEKILTATLTDSTVSIEQLRKCIDVYHALSLIVGSHAGYYHNLSKTFFNDKIALQQQLITKICELLKKLDLSPVEKIDLFENLLFKTIIEEQHPTPYHEDKNPFDIVDKSMRDAYLNKKMMEDKILKFKFIYNEKFPDPEVKAFLINSYVNALVEFTNPEFKKDEDYLKFKKVIDKILDNTSISFSNEILAQFADRISAQRELSEYIKTRLDTKKQMEVEDNYIPANVGFVWLNEVCGQPEARKAFLEFLLSPLSGESCKKVFNDSHYYIYEIKYTQYNDNIGTRLMLMHKEFWSSDPIARAAIFQKLLYSKNFEEDKRTTNDIANEVKTYVLDTVLPLPQEAKDSEERKVVSSYLTASNEAEQSTVLAMMLASQEPSPDPNAKKTHGQVLKIVLDNLGPAGTKMAQAINSHPSTPADIKRDTAKSKSMANKPNRWELFDLIDACYGEKAEDVSYVGTILGAGAYGVTVQLKKYDEQDTALTLLRSYAFEKAKTEFDTLYRSAQDLVKKDPKYDPVITMVKQADKASDEETNMKLAEQQDKIAQRLYNNVEIQIGDEEKGNTYIFTTAEWLGYGTRYKETAIIPGTHFMDMPETTPEEKAEKRNIAIAILTIELRNLVAGKEFDHDRHGAQQRIFGMYIGQFDFGGVSLKPPTDEEKWLIGQVIGKVMRAVEAGSDMVDSLQKALRVVGNKEKHKDFLAKVERAVLSLNEYAPFVSKDDMISIFAAIRPHMHSEIAKSLGSNLVGKNSITNYFFSGTALNKLDTQLSSQVKTPIKIIQKKSPIPKTMTGQKSNLFSTSSELEQKKPKKDSAQILNNPTKPGM